MDASSDVAFAVIGVGAVVCREIFNRRSMVELRHRIADLSQKLGREVDRRREGDLESRTALSRLTEQMAEIARQDARLHEVEKALPQIQLRLLQVDLEAGKISGQEARTSVAERWIDHLGVELARIEHRVDEIEERLKDDEEDQPAEDAKPRSSRVNFDIDVFAVLTSVGPKVVSWYKNWVN